MLILQVRVSLHHVVELQCAFFPGYASRDSKAVLLSDVPGITTILQFSRPVLFYMNLVSSSSLSVIHTVTKTQRLLFQIMKVIPIKLILVCIFCVLQRTRGQKRKRVSICEDREDKAEVFNLFPLITFLLLTLQMYLFFTTLVLAWLPCFLEKKP